MLKPTCDFFPSAEVNDGIGVHTFVNLVFIFDVIIIVASTRHEHSKGPAFSSLVLNVLGEKYFPVLHKLGCLELHVESVATVSSIHELHFDSLLQIV